LKDRLSHSDSDSVFGKVTSATGCQDCPGLFVQAVLSDFAARNIT
jgi:hypothetical protein